jgi:hypothetical protein
MIDLDQAVVLALLQGFTEFLPVSSSAHRLFPSRLQGWPGQGLAFDVAVHAGTLSAVRRERRLVATGTGRRGVGNFGLRLYTVCGGCSMIDRIEAKHTTG